ncbi:MAG: hypothetical protein R2710_03755 [Acidimicrobiales bacterium]
MIEVDWVVDSSILAFSAASLTLRRHLVGGEVDAVGVLELGG